MLYLAKVMTKNKLLKICLIIFIFSVSVFLFLKFNTSKKIETKTNTENTTKKEEPKIVSCTRTTRLENEPYFDRALSLIEEKYKSWETSNHDYYTAFPSQLTNCIKIIEDETVKTDEAEGYFIFNDKEISDNYFPIHIDKNYRYSDEAVNSLLLIHEITHVQQYIDETNGKSSLSCIDKEVEAFNAQYNFYINLSGEYAKSVDLRIKNDGYLNPQLQIIKTIRQKYMPNGIIISLQSRCKNGSGGKDCLNNDQKIIIKEIISQEDGYKKQCNL